MEQQKAKEIGFNSLINDNYQNSPFDLKYEANKRILSILNSYKSPENKRKELLSLLEQSNSITNNINYAMNNIPNNLIELYSDNNESDFVDKSIIGISGNAIVTNNNISTSDKLTKFEDVSHNIEPNSSQNLIIKNSDIFEQYANTLVNQMQNFKNNSEYDILDLEEKLMDFYDNYNVNSIYGEEFDILNQTQNNQIKILTNYINRYKELLRKQHIQIKQLKKGIIEKSNNGEVIFMEDEIKTILDKLDKIDEKYNNKIDKLIEKINDIDKKTLVIETDLNYVKKNTNEIKDNIKDLPLLKSNVDILIEKRKWWKQYLLSPIVTGVVVGIVLLIAKKITG